MKTIDFEPQADGAIAVPSIQINFRGSAHDRCAISSFMEETTKALLDSFEMIIVHMCSKNIQPLGPFPMSIGLMSENHREAWHVRFAYGMYDHSKMIISTDAGGKTKRVTSSGISDTKNDIILYSIVEGYGRPMPMRRHLATI